MNFSNGSTANSTPAPPYDPMKLQKFVTFNLYMGALAWAVATVFNTFILVAFIRRPRLITPFTVQILNFVVIQMFTLLLEGPLNITTFLQPVFFTKKAFCAIYKFGAWSTMSIALLQQMAIGIDRWMALLHPVWYRRKTTAFGVKVTLSLIAYYFALYLPLFIMDCRFDVPAGHRCDIHNVWPVYQIVVRLSTYYLPQFFTYISYPILVIMIRVRQRRIAQNKTERTNVNTVEGTAAEPTIGLKKVAERTSVRRTSQLSMWMMLAQIICSVPLTVTYGLIQLKIELPYLHDFNSFSIMLSSVNMVVDPLIYCIFFRELREEVRRLMRCQCA